MKSHWKPKKEPKKREGFKTKVCPKCGRDIKDDRLEHHMTTAYCAIKAKRLEKVERSKYEEERDKAREQAASLDAFRCMYCHKNSRTEDARLKHESKCKVNPNRIGPFDKTPNLRVKKKEPGEVTPEEMSAVIAGEATPIERKKELCPDLDHCENSGTDKCFDCNRLVPGLDNDYFRRRLAPDVCEKCGKTVYGPMEHHKQKCKGVPVVDAKELEVKPFNVSGIQVTEKAVVPEIKPLLNQKKPDKDARYCVACGTVIDDERSILLCDKCKKASKKAPGAKYPKIVAAKRGA